MAPSLFYALLLAALLCGIAHARHIANATDLAQRPLTSSFEARIARNDSDDLDDTGIEGENAADVVELPLEPCSRRNILSAVDSVAVSIRPSSSVVQDWSLVCQQLCGANLGGAPCAAHCNTIGVHPDVEQLNQQEKNADDILNSSKDAICQDLCSLQLGDDSCDCATQFNNISDATDDNDTITSGAPSTTKAPNNDSEKIKSCELSVADRNEVCSIFCAYNGATLTGCSLCNDDGKVSEFVARDTNDGSTSTTPNWTQMCAALCKTGDGGSLCNCDLSPFF